MSFPRAVFPTGQIWLWTVNAHLSFDAAYERYQMKGRDGVTSQSAFPDADIVTVGARLVF